MEDQPNNAEQHFSAVSDNYKSYRPDYPLELAAFLSEQCETSSLAVDVGCGNGQLSVLLADYFQHVIATDASKKQVANAQVRNNIEYRCETAEKISCDNNSADLVVAAQAAHWFNLDAFYQEVHRIAKPTATIALISYGVQSIESSANSLLQTFYWETISQYWPPERAHVENGYTNFPFPFTEAQAPLFAIKRQWDLDTLCNYISTWSAIGEANKQGKEKLFTQFKVDLKKAWGDEKNTVTVEWPISIRIGHIA